jgi:hypothetical protein
MANPQRPLTKRCHTSNKGAASTKRMAPTVNGAIVKLPNSNDTTTPMLPHEMAANATNPIPAIFFDILPLTTLCGGFVTIHYTGFLRHAEISRLNAG